MIKYTLLSILLYANFFHVFAQICNPGKSIQYLNANNITASFNLGGDMFHIGTVPNFVVNSKDQGKMISSLYTTSLWMSGEDVNGNIKLSMQTYDPAGNGQSYRPYGINQTICDKWDKQWKISKGDIIGHIADWNDNHFIDNKIPSIYSWPAVGNQFFVIHNGFSLPNDIDSFASFHDQNNDNIYNPDEGDFPVIIDSKNGTQIIPDQMLWYMFNDNAISNDANPLGMIIQVTSWAFESQDILINNTVFTEHVMKYIGPNPLTNFKSAIWSDMNLGCPEDDYFGCNKELSCFFTYNSDSLDGQPGINCSGINTFDNDPGVQSITFLSHNLNSFIYTDFTPIIPAGEPVDPYIQYYKYMYSMFRDGAHLSYGGNGYFTGIDTDYAFDGNPNNNLEWSMKSANLPAKNMSVLGTIYYGELNPGDTRRFTTAYTYFNNPDLKSTSSDIDSMYAGVKRLHNIYDDFFNGYTSSTYELNDSDISIYPNPAQNNLNIKSEKEGNYEVELLDILGNIHYKTKSNLTNLNIDTSNLSSGIYLVRLRLKASIYTKKLIVLK